METIQIGRHSFKFHISIGSDIIRLLVQVISTIPENKKYIIESEEYMCDVIVGGIYWPVLYNDSDLFDTIISNWKNANVVRDILVKMTHLVLVNIVRTIINKAVGASVETLKGFSGLLKKNLDPLI